MMDNLLLFTPSKESHMNKLEDLLKALLKNGLKILPKKCQLFRTSLQYMGNEIFIQNRKVCVQPLRNRLEAIQRLQPQSTAKGWRSFPGMVNFLNMFCPELQKLLKPIYDLTIHVHSTDPTHSINNVDDRIVNNNPFIPDAPFNPDSILRPAIKPIKQNMTHGQSSQNVQDINPNINFDFEENSPFQEGIMLETFQRTDKSFFQEPKELEDLINKGNFVHKYLPKQTDIDKIQRKVLKGTHLPIEIKEIQAGYLCSPYFKDLYLYLSQNKLPTSKSAVRKIETLAEKYVLLDSLLFRISSEKETTVLAVPETCADKIITLYHKSLFAGHQGVIKTYLTISDKFFIPNLIHYLRSYIKGCHLCQLACNEKSPPRQLQARINPNYVPMSRLSMDLKVMPRSHKGHKYILCVIDEVTNYLVTVPIFQARSEEIGEALIEML